MIRSTITKILDKDGKLVGQNWAQFNVDQTLDAEWYENKIDVVYRKGASCSGTGNVPSALSCSVDGTFNLPTEQESSGLLGTNQHLTEWRVTNDRWSPGEELDCTRGTLGGNEGTAVYIEAACTTQPNAVNSGIIMHGFIMNN